MESRNAVRLGKIKRFVKRMFDKFGLDGLVELKNVIDTSINNLEKIIKNKEGNSRLNHHKLEFLKDVERSIVSKSILELLP